MLSLDGELEGGLQQRVQELLPPPDLSGIKAEVRGNPAKHEPVPLPAES